MNRLRDLYAASHRWPVRVRIAIVSAVLTAVILIGFAVVVGRLTSDRIHSDFEKDLQSTVTQLAAQGGRSTLPDVLGGDALVRIADASGNTLTDNDGNLIANNRLASRLGSPQAGEIVQAGEYEVAAAEILQASDPIPALGPYYVQYARPESAVNETIGRLWFFLGGGVVVGTLLSGLAGMAVANRAMRPISALTAAAGDIATTRDPSRRLPQPESDDEVAELARTLDQMLRELDAARSETDDAMQRQREFVADASHELRTPLTSILANLELLDHSLRADDADDDDDRAAVSSALRSSKRMNRLVGDLLLIARADAGRAGQRTDCDLAAIARDACEELAPVSAGHDLSFDSEGPVHVRGNADELHRMILNLLENAIRHTPAGTRVRMRTTASDGEAELTVADDGPGLPEGMESQIFERFVRGEGPADRQSQNGTGTGLGLSIVRAVAVAHGGDVSAANAEDRGARFTVRIPLAEV